MRSLITKVALATALVAAGSPAALAGEAAGSTGRSRDELYQAVPLAPVDGAALAVRTWLYQQVLEAGGTREEACARSEAASPGTGAPTRTNPREALLYAGNAVAVARR